MPSTLKITTSSGSVYLYGNGQVLRVPDAHDAIEKYVALPLRRDLEAIPVLDGTREPVVGERWMLLLDVRGDGIMTVRETTPITEIVEIANETEEVA